MTVTDTDEAASWGAALCAGAAVRIYKSPLADPRDLAKISKTYQPNAAHADALNERYQFFCDMAEAMKPFWSRLEKLGLEHGN